MKLTRIMGGILASVILATGAIAAAPVAAAANDINALCVKNNREWGNCGISPDRAVITEGETIPVTVSGVPGRTVDVQIFLTNHNNQTVAISDRVPARLPASSAQMTSVKVHILANNVPAGFERSQALVQPAGWRTGDRVVPRNMQQVPPQPGIFHVAKRVSGTNFNVYTTPGAWNFNNRLWRTWCEPYSATERCRTEIWATQILYQNGNFSRTDGWAFNNLTYKASPRAIWKGNPIGGWGETGPFNRTFQQGGRDWRVECDTATSGRGGCRSYIRSTVAEAAPSGGYRTVTKEVFNNIVLFS